MAKRKAKAAAAAPDPPPPQMLNTWGEIARYVGVHERTVSATWQAAGLTKPISVPDLEQWLKANKRGDRTDRRPTDAKKAKLQVRKLRAETELVERKAAAARRELIPVHEVLSCVIPYVNAAKVLLENVPERLLPYLADQASFRRRAEEAIAEVCTQLADAAADMTRAIQGESPTDAET